MTDRMFTILSAFDDRARPRGSRDPLGAEACWSHLGRRLVGNLTTVTWNLDNFIVALLCCRYAHQEQDGGERIQERYLRAEQVAAYLKLAAQDRLNGVLGITRAAKNFTSRPIPLGMAPEAQLLASQASYGLWGLYSGALEGAGLIAGADRRLTPAGEALAGATVARFSPDNWKEFCRLAGLNALNRELTQALAPDFVAILGDPALRGAAVDALLARQDSCALQHELFPLAQRYLLQQEDWSHEDFCEWSLKHAEAGEELRTVLQRIRSLDPLLRFAETVMQWLQGKNNEPVDALENALRPHLQGLSLEQDWLAQTDMPHRAFLKDLLAALSDGDAAAVIRSLLKQNRALMQARGGAAWIELDGTRRLVVRVRNDQPRDLEGMGRTGAGWRFNYFLYSFLSITRQGLT